MQKLIIDPSIATVLEIEPVSILDRTPLYFEIEDDNNWIGQFEVKFYNSDSKNNEFQPNGVNPLTASGKMLSWIIHPIPQGLEAKKYYFEIFSTHFERIIFKGTLPIVK